MKKTIANFQNSKTQMLTKRQKQNLKGGDDYIVIEDEIIFSPSTSDIIGITDVIVG